MTPLCDLATKYGTDKAIPHHYTPIYYAMLAPKREDIKRVLEIGICVKRDLPNGRTGASLFMWEEFFPNAEIFGIDIDPASMVNEGRITSYLADQTDPVSLNAAMRQMGPTLFDVIIDDGSHDPRAQSIAALTLLQFLAPNGTYFIEDVYVDPAHIMTRIPPAYSCEVYEGGKIIPEGMGRREFGGPPAGEQLLVIRRR